MSEGKIEKLAVLIDADNAQPSIVDGLLAEVAKYGTANVKIAYLTRLYKIDEFNEMKEVIELLLKAPPSLLPAGGK